MFYSGVTLAWLMLPLGASLNPLLRVFFLDYMLIVGYQHSMWVVLDQSGTTANYCQLVEKVWESQQTRRISDHQEFPVGKSLSYSISSAGS